MFLALFFSKNTMMLETLTLLLKIPQKLTVFQDVYGYYLILHEKQRLKQVENCSMISCPTFNTHQTYKHTMIREVFRVCLYFVTFSMMKPSFNLFPQDLEALMSGIVMFWVLTHQFLSIISQNQNQSKNQGLSVLARFLGRISQSAGAGTKKTLVWVRNDLKVN